MTRNQLPEGVGKKIVEALKRQAEADITPLEDNGIISNSIPLTEIEDLPDIQFEQVEEDFELNDAEIIEEDVLPVGVYKEKEEVYAEEQYDEQAYMEPQYVEQPQVQNIAPQPQIKVQPQAKSFTFEERPMPKRPTMKTSQVALPANVAVLKNLIATLPVGVTKQTGAQIIRQTIEAMGIPMNTVLKEAQEIQEDLNSSTRECMLKIQEYKACILQLEQSVQQYQQNITQINDLVSLFLMTDKN